MSYKELNQPENFAHKASLLFWSHGVNSTTISSNHAHSFWQMEIIVKKSSKLLAGAGTLLLPSKTVLLLPPGCEHKLYHDDPQRESWSLKFDLEINIPNSNPVVPGKDSTAKGLCDILFKIISEDYLQKESLTVEYLLADIVHAHYMGRKDKKEEPAIAGKLKKLLNSSNCNMGVSEAAKRLGFSRGHLNLKFRKETGLSVKKFIDKERFIKARKHLLYSDMNLSEIAEELEFSDLFVFSKFFKRMSGKSPREFLKASEGHPD